VLADAVVVDGVAADDDDDVVGSDSPAESDFELHALPNNSATRTPATGESLRITTSV